MITHTEKVILELIRKALDASYEVDASVFAKDACGEQGRPNWAEVIEVATTQGVLGLCFEAIEQLDASCRPDMDNLMNMLGQVEYMSTMYEEHLRAITELADFYNSQQIKMILLKGYGLSLYWPVPKHRPVGDIDIYLGHLWQFGDQMVQDRLGIEVESGHEHHTTFSYNGIMVENHYDFINVKAHKDARHIEDKLKELASSGSKKVKIGKEGKESTSEHSALGSAAFIVLAEKEQSKLSEPSILLPSADFNVIFLIRHLGQHFAGERVTLRQLLDVLFFLKAEGNNVHWDEVIPFLKEMSIWTFFNLICAIGEDYLGMKLPIGFKIERKEDLEKRILQDILHPEFAEEKPHGLLPVLWFKARRWWYNRWKHPLVYNEWWLPMLLTLAWSHLRHIETIKD